MCAAPRLVQQRHWKVEVQHLECVRSKYLSSGASFGMVTTSLPLAVLRCAELWLGFTSAGSSSCSSMPCNQTHVT